MRSILRVTESIPEIGFEEVSNKLCSLKGLQTVKKVSNSPVLGLRIFGILHEADHHRLSHKTQGIEALHTSGCRDGYFLKILEAHVIDLFF